MKTFKAAALLSSMDTAERRRFREYITLPLFNREQYVVVLFDLVEPALQQLPDNQAIFSHLYPGQAFNDGRIRYLKAQLYALLRKFIFLKQPGMLFEDVAVFQYFREKKLFDLYEKEQNKQQSDQPDKAPADSAAYLHRYFLAFEWHNFHTQTNRVATVYLDQLNLNLDTFYIIEKLKLACTAFNLRRLYKVQVETSLLEPLLAQLQQQRMY
ncbi:MAG: hypothetical protein IT260_13285 [Saprospiraceae bacterium]|nr:hypothetical protein [Saprospiraceae bacterium]